MKQMIAALLILICVVADAQDSVLIFQRKTPIPGNARVDLASFTIDSNVYVIGGVDTLGTYNNEVWRYNITGNLWQNIGHYPGGALYAPGSFSINGKGYVCVGEDSMSGGATTHLWEYDPANNNWTRKADFPGIPRRIPSCFSFEGKGYIGNGMGIRSDLWSYDPQLNHWAQMDTLPGIGRYGVAPVVVDSSAYFVGGYKRFATDCLNEVWRYKIRSGNWERLADIPGLSAGFQPTWALGGFLVSGYGVHIDGTSFSLGRGFYIYDIAHNTWDSILIRGFVDSIAEGANFQVGAIAGYLGGTKSLAHYAFCNDLWTTDLSSLLTDTGTTTINAIDGAENRIRLYPNPASSIGSLVISASGAGEVCFYDDLGRVLYHITIADGVNVIACRELHSTGLICYSVSLRDGSIVRGRLVLY